MKWSADSTAKRARKSSNFFFIGRFYESIHTYGRRWPVQQASCSTLSADLRKEVALATFCQPSECNSGRIWRLHCNLETHLIVNRHPASHDPVSFQVSRWRYSCKHMPCMTPHLCSISQQCSFQGNSQQRATQGVPETYPLCLRESQSAVAIWRLRHILQRSIPQASALMHVWLFDCNKMLYL